MGDRKVTNKYIPADFDPSKVPRGKKLSQKDGTVPVRMMLPFSVQCSTCMTFLYRGRKFNSKKEPMGGSEGKYLGITRFRFYIKCTHCSRPVTFLTDPKNADYEMESGGTRNYEVYKDEDKKEESAAAEQEQAEKEDPMKALENRVLDSQKEMADMDNLEEIKAMNYRHAKLLNGPGSDFDAETQAVLAIRERKDALEAAETQGLTAEDEALVKSIKFGGGGGGQSQDTGIRRLDEHDEKMLEERRKAEAALVEERQRELLQKTAAAAAKKSSMPVIKFKRKIPVADTSAKKAKVEAPVSNNGGLSGLLGDYGSDSDSD
jgi:hypothetical protein